MIEIKKLNKYYNLHKKNEIHVINNTTLSLPDTGFVCIVGESGSGKTTLLNTISGLDSFKNGSIRVNDIVLNKYSMRQADRIRQANYGYVFQNYYLLTNRSVYENVNMVLDEFSLKEEEKRERINYVLKQVGLFRYRNKLVMNLSGGEQQRVSIARALVKTPTVIFADEPTGSLDEKNTIQVMNILKKLSKNHLIVMVTHEVNIVNFYADRIITIDDGKIVDDKVVEGNDELSMPMDRNIYLSEFESKKVISDGKNQIELYGDYEKANIKLQIAFKSGKSYVKVIGDGVEIINNSNEVDLKEGEREVITDETIDNFNYDLSPIDNKKIKSISFSRLIKYAIGNIKFTRWRNIFLFIVLIAVSVLSVISLDDISNLRSIDYKTILTASNGNLNVDVELDAPITKTELNEQFDILYNNVLNEIESSNSDDVDLYCDINTPLMFEFNEFEQTYNEYSVMLSDFDYKTMDYFDESTLIYGNVPTKENEIVVDEWVIQKMLNKNGALKNMVNHVSLFVGKEFKTEDKFGGRTVKITGISHCESPTIFVDKFYGVSLLSWGTQIGNIDRLKKEDPIKYGNYDLSLGEVIVDSTLFQITTYSNKYNALDTYKVVGVEDCDYEIIMTEKSLDRFIKYICEYFYTFKVISNGQNESITNYLYNYRKINSESESIRVVVSNQYKEQIDTAYNNALNKVKNRLIVTAALIVFSIFIIFFAMKSSASRQINEIAVFRALGFTRFSFSLIYIVELFIISCMTTLLGVIFTSLTLRLIDSVPLIEYTYYCKNNELIILTLCLFVINMVVGLIPIISIMRLTPSKIYSKYDL